MIQYLGNIELNGFRFDSCLFLSRLSANQNYDLTITLRIYLNKVNPTAAAEYVDYQGTRFRVGNWPDAEWNDISSVFQYYGEEWWDNKFWLRTPRDIDTRLPIVGVDSDMANPPVYSVWRPETCPEIFPHVNCRFNLEQVDSRGAAHCTINMRYFTEVFVNDTWRRTNPEFANPRSSAVDMDYDDIFGTTTEYEGVILRNLTIPHEIGHLMGLQHSGIVRREAACLAEISRSGSAGGNHDLCYGSTLESRRDIMGAGEDLSWYDALPWRVAIEQHTGINKHLWEVRQSVIHGEYDPIR